LLSQVGNLGYLEAELICIHLKQIQYAWRVPVAKCADRCHRQMGLLFHLTSIDRLKASTGRSHQMVMVVQLVADR
jgi:hypothetical protein